MKFLKFIKSKFNKTVMSLLLLSSIVFTPACSVFADIDGGSGSAGGISRNDPLIWTLIDVSSAKTYEDKMEIINEWVYQHPSYIAPNFYFTDLQAYKNWLGPTWAKTMPTIDENTDFVIFPLYGNNTNYLYGSVYKSSVCPENMDSTIPEWISKALVKYVNDNSDKTCWWIFTSNDFPQPYPDEIRLRVRVYKESADCKGDPYVTVGDGDDPPGCDFKDRLGDKDWTAKINYEEYFDNSQYYQYPKTNAKSGERYGATDYDVWHAKGATLKADLVKLPEGLKSSSGEFSFHLIPGYDNTYQTLNMFVKEEEQAYKIRIRKADEDGNTITDSSATFKMWYEEDEHLWGGGEPSDSRAKSGQNAWMYTTTNGYTEWDTWARNPGTVIKYKEVKAPDGYIKDSTTYSDVMQKGENSFTYTVNNKKKDKKPKPKPKPDPKPDPNPPYDCGEWRNYTPSKTPDSIKGVYEVKTVITPITPKGFSDWDTETQNYWKSTHHKQERTELTPLGKFLKSQGDIVRKLTSFDNETNAYMNMWNKLVEGSNKAIKEGVQKVNIELTSKNKEGFARGGIFTVTELRKDINISTVHTQDREQYYKCVYEKEWRTGRRWSYLEDKYIDYDYYVYVFKGYESTSYIRNKKYPYTRAATSTLNSWYIHSSWQYLSARCNKEGIEKAKVASHGKDITFGSSYGSTAIESPLVYKTTAKFYGNSSHSNKDLAATGKAEFFTTNKSCEESTLCTPEKRYASNDSINNVLDDSKYNILNGKYGAQHDKTTATSEFSFFRDNVFKAVRNDVWYPLASGKEIDDQRGRPSHATFFAFDKKGTPQDELFSFGKTDKEDYIDGKIKKLPTDNIIETKGQVNKFGFRGAFASEKENPHRMNIKYGWKTKILNHVPTIVNGRKHEKLVPIPSDINMYCDVLFNTKENGHAIFENTPMWRKLKAPKQFNDKKNHSMTIRFVKTSVE